MAKNNSTIEKKYLIIILLSLFVAVVFASWSALKRSVGLVVGDFFSPYISVAKLGQEKLSDQSLLLYNRMELAVRLEAVNKINNELAIKARELDEVRKENVALRKLLSLDVPSKWEYISAEIILRDPLYWQEYFVISCKNINKVTVGAAVIAIDDGGAPKLVGVVDNVGNKNIRVITIYNSSLKLAVSLGENNIGVLNAGELTSNLQNNIPVGFLPVDGKYKLQEIAYTTGFDKKIPKGLDVGKLTSIDEIPTAFSGEPHVNGTITATNLDNIQFLYIAVRNENKIEN